MAILKFDAIDRSPCFRDVINGFLDQKNIGLDTKIVFL